MAYKAYLRHELLFAGSVGPDDSRRGRARPCRADAGADGGDPRDPAWWRRVDLGPDGLGQDRRLRAAAARRPRGPAPPAVTEAGADPGAGTNTRAGHPDAGGVPA